MAEDFICTNRNLEQWLYENGIVATNETKTEDYMTAWHYPRTEEVMEAVRFFGKTLERKKNMTKPFQKAHYDKPAASPSTMSNRYGPTAQII